MKIYTVYRHEPVKVNKKFGDEIPPHSDMLRYDLAFCNPADVSQVIFPIFVHRGTGRTTNQITHGRWDSFSMKVTLTRGTNMEPVGHWVTYVHGQNHELVPQTLDEYLARPDKPKIVGWR